MEQQKISTNIFIVIGIMAFLNGFLLSDKFGFFSLEFVGFGFFYIFTVSLAMYWGIYKEREKSQSKERKR